MVEHFKRIRTKVEVCAGVYTGFGAGETRPVAGETGPKAQSAWGSAAGDFLVVAAR